MAILRCLEAHACPPAKKGGPHCSHYVKPIGYPIDAPECGLCPNPGVLWLELWEVAAYGSGERVFRLGARQLRVRADDDGVHILDSQRDDEANHR
jgi:hypothetical protein